MQKKTRDLADDDTQVDTQSQYLTTKRIREKTPEQSFKKMNLPLTHQVSIASRESEVGSWPCTLKR